MRLLKTYLPSPILDFEKSTEYNWVSDQTWEKEITHLNIEQGNQGEGDSDPAASEHVGVLRELGLTLPTDETLGVGADVVPMEEPSQAQKDSRQTPTNESIGFGQSTNHTLSYGPGGITVKKSMVHNNR